MGLYINIYTYPCRESHRKKEKGKGKGKGKGENMQVKIKKYLRDSILKANKRTKISINRKKIRLWINDHWKKT